MISTYRAIIILFVLQQKSLNLCRKKLNMDQIHDIHGLRLIVENKEDCYRALRVVQCLWSEVPGQFKDYITNPKFNGYVFGFLLVVALGYIYLF